MRCAAILGKILQKSLWNGGPYLRIQVLDEQESFVGLARSNIPGLHYTYFIFFNWFYFKRNNFLKNKSYANS